MDEISFDTPKFRIGETRSPTYQSMASALMKMYDPQGLMEPIRVMLKSLYSRNIKLTAHIYALLVSEFKYKPGIDKTGSSC